MNAQKKPNNQMTGADLIVQSLKAQGVDVVFGYPGGASMSIHQAISHSENIRMVLPRHERGAVFAASGYARASGRAGVCLAASGAGAANIISGIMDAKMDSVPLIALTGQVPTYAIGMDAFQESDIFGATLPCVKHSYLVKEAQDIPGIIEEAFYFATTGRKGPVLIDFPKDVQQSHVVPATTKKWQRRGYNPHLEPAKNQIKKAVKAICEAKRPVVYAGGGVIASESYAELRLFIEKTGIPVATTLSGVGIFPEDHPLSLNMMGKYGAVYANIAVNKADLVIVLGARFDDRVIGNHKEFCQGAKIIHVDVDASEINKIKEVHIPIQGDVKLTLQAFNDMITQPFDFTAWHKQIAVWKKEFAHSYPQPQTDIVPQDVIVKLKQVLPRDVIITVGVGQFQMWVAQFFGFHLPRSFVCSAGLGAKGFGLPAAIGAQTAFPERMVVDIDGDGNLLMNIQEFQTISTEKIPVKCVVFNNKHLGMVAAWDDHPVEAQKKQTYLGETDFAALAGVFGIAGETITTTDQILPALQRMIAHKGPYVLDVQYPYNNDPLGQIRPRIPSGGTYLDTIMSDGTLLRDYLEQQKK